MRNGDLVSIDTLLEASPLKTIRKKTSAALKKMKSPKVGKGQKSFDYFDKKDTSAKKPKIAKRQTQAVRPKAKPGGIPKKASDSGKSDLEIWPANWKTTAPGNRVPMPAEIKKRQRAGKDVNQSDFYKHVVRAIYVTGIKNGYPFRGTPAKSAQQIARAKMIKWGYASRASKKGGVPDKLSIKLTGAGIKRGKKHQGEPRVIRVAKDRDYRSIVATDPL